jgi:DNA polymerase III epsilon subunit family exonuclease
MTTPLERIAAGETPYVFFDVETTGLTPKRDRIIEIAALRFDRSSGELASFQTLVQPGRAIPAFVRAMTGLDDSAFTDAPEAKDALARFFEFAGEDPLVAYNIGFDYGFVAAEAEREGLEAPTTTVCAMRFAQSRIKDVPNHRLETVAKALDCPRPRARRAMEDCLTGLIVFEKTLEL